MLTTIALRKALYARLSTSLDPVPVFAQVPKGQSFPYVRIGDVAVTDSSAKDTEIHTSEVQIHVFTRDSESPLEVETIMADLYAALHEQDTALTMEAGLLIQLRCGFSSAFQQGEPNDTYWHGVQRYRALTQDS